MHYHGTCIAEAVDALLSGQELRSLRPKGSSRSPGAKDGYVHLTPSFALAATYAFNGGREDWPTDHSLTTLRGHGWVFGFEADIASAVPDEDEVGHAARAALAMEIMGESPWTCMNQAFSKAVDADGEYRSMLLDRMRATSKIARMIEGVDPRRIRGPAIVRLGNAVRDALTVDEIAWTLSLGPSIATAPGPVPILAYRLDRLVFDPSGLEAIDIQNPALAI